VSIIWKEGTADLPKAELATAEGAGNRHGIQRECSASDVFVALTVGPLDKDLM
jgi:hypothetical protein